MSANPGSGHLRHELRRWLLLLGGLFVYGLSLRLMIDSHLGASPWDVFHIGVSGKTGLSVGQVSIATGAALLALTALGLRERVGVGTVLNVVLIGLWIDWLAPAVPDPSTPLLRWLQFGLGTLLLGFATGAYVGAGMGAGPRDSLMLGLGRLTGWPVARIRTGIELLVYGIGLLLGGPLGWGTLFFALAVGTSVAWGLRIFGVYRKPSA